MPVQPLVGRLSVTWWRPEEGLPRRVPHPAPVQPERLAVVAWGCTAGLIQQACTRAFRVFMVSGAFGSKRAEAGDAAERRLDVAAGAAEPVVEIEMAEGGVEIVPPHQADHAAAEPDAFGIAGRTVDGLGGLGEFVDLALVVPGRVLGRGGALLLLLLGPRSPLWAERRGGSQHQSDRGDRSPNCTATRRSESCTTHEVPEIFHRKLPTRTCR